MKRLRKIAFLLSMVLLLILAACGSKDKKNSDETLKVWQMGNSDWKQIIEPFEEESGLKVDIQGIPWDNGHDKLLTAVASGNGPDIILMGSSWMQEFVDAGTFVDLTDYVDEYENLNLDNFYEDALETSVFDDSVYGIPWHVDTRALFYRTDILEDIGYPEGPETWDEMLDVSDKLVNRDGGEYAIDLAPKDINVIYFLAFQKGWEYEDDLGAENFKKPEFVDTIKLYETFYDKEYSQLGKGKELAQAFEDGTKPMFFSGPWDIKNINDNAPAAEGKWAIRTMPVDVTGDSMIGGSQITIFKESDKVDEALEFINWLSTEDTQLEWYDVKKELPSLKDAWDDPVLADDPMFSVFGEQLEAVQAPPVKEGNEQINQEIMKTVEKVIRGGEDVDSAIEDLYGKIDKILSK